MTLNLVNWNVEWATPASHRSTEILNRIDSHTPEIVCLTETHVGLLPGGHVICSRPDYGYPIKEVRRKVLLWSSEPWEHVDDVGDDQMPPGRFVSGMTRTSVGAVTVIGVCIPWSGSRTGPRFAVERRRWEDHEEYLACLVGVLEKAPSKRLILMGDFNQRVGQGAGTSRRLQSALRRAIPPHIMLATSALGLRGRRTIDHIAMSADIAVESLGVISNMHGERTLTDHFGVVADVSGRSS